MTGENGFFGYVESDFGRQGVNIWLGTRIGTPDRIVGRSVVQHGGAKPSRIETTEEMRTLEGTHTVIAPSIAISDDEARELYAALGRFYGPDGHDNTRALRKDYNDERARVDRLQDALVGIAARVTHPQRNDS